jgi:hypothetical protein
MSKELRDAVVACVLLILTENWFKKSSHSVEECHRLLMDGFFWFGEAADLFKGLKNMTDQELALELGCTVDELNKVWQQHGWLNLNELF